MAENQHTTPASRRRTLFAAASAVILGSGIAAGAAASVADLVPVDPDADLIEACQSALIAIEKQNVLTAPFETLSPDHPHYRAHCNAAYERVYEISQAEYHPAIARAVDLSAHTLAGLRAKAGLVFDTEDEQLGISLARDVLAWRA